jgi:hypothetical protein
MCLPVIVSSECIDIFAWYWAKPVLLAHRTHGAKLGVLHSITNNTFEGDKVGAR